ncbi:MAG: methyltransferase family protein, partial [Candidatus Thorarchaeota archaeon]
PLTAWGALMIIPFIGYIALLFTSSPMQFIEALALVFFGGFLWEQIIAIFGISILVYSFIHMRLTRRDGLITSGPYRIVRHPQYLGVVSFTLTLTTRSYWIAKNTFGMSWISPETTVAIWIGTLFAYNGLAIIEELHLTEVYSLAYHEYRKETGFLIPWVKSENRVFEVMLSALFPLLLLAVIIQLPPPFPPLL